MTAYHATYLVLMSALIVGCQGQADVTNMPAADGQQVAATPESKTLRGEAVRAVDAEEFASQLAAYQGDVVLVDMWATW